MTLRRIFDILDPLQRRQVAILLVAMVFGAGLEALGVGLIMPLIALLSDPDPLSKYWMLQQLHHALGLSSTKDLLLMCCVGLLIVYLGKNAYLGWMYKAQYAFTYHGQANTARKLLREYLSRPYTFHVQKNSSELLRNINEEVRVLFGQVVRPIATVIVEGTVLLVLGLLLVIIEPVVTPIAFLVFGGIGGSFYLFVRKKSAAYGRLKQASAKQMIKTVNQSLGGIKEIKTLGKNEYFVDEFTESSLKYADAQMYQSVVAVLPRFVIESIGLGGMLLVMSLLVWRDDPLNEILPVLGVFAMAAFRAMPSMTRIISSLTSIRHFGPALDVVYDDLVSLRNVPLDIETQPQPAAPPQAQQRLKDRLTLRNVTYSYPNTDKLILKSINLEVHHGESIALVGSSGAGKTTTADMILGLLEPDSGDVLVDGVSVREMMSSWRKQVGYIPQAIYLLDESIRRNIALGVPDQDISDEQVWKALASAQLATFVKGLPEGLDTRVGEFGVRFSGGQRQRIGIARALYHDPSVLVLDEATSALDTETERHVAEAIAMLREDKMLIIIAHRLSTVKDCDRIILMKDGEIIERAPYDKLIEISAEFRSLANAKH